MHVVGIYYIIHSSFLTPSQPALLLGANQCVANLPTPPEVAPEPRVYHSGIKEVFPLKAGSSGLFYRVEQECICAHNTHTILCPHFLCGQLVLYPTHVLSLAEVVELGDPV